MQRSISDIVNSKPEVVVIGAGIYGACIARDAAMRGIRTVIIDASDFGGETSHNSYKVIHGGLRYLQHMDFRRVVESIRETNTWLRIAPQWVRPLEFAMPFYDHGIRGREAMTLGLHLHGGMRTLFGRQSSLQAKLAGSRIDQFGDSNNLYAKRPLGLARWQEGQLLDSWRVVFGCVQDAVNHGALAANYVKATKIVNAKGRVAAVECRDMLTGLEFTIHTPSVVVAAGPWSDELAQNVAAPKILSANVILDCKLDDSALAFYSDEKSESALGKTNRLYFAMPWFDRTIVGTSERTYSGLASNCPHPQEEIFDLVRACKHAFPTLEQAKPVYAHWGMTPANESNGHTPSKRHKIVDHGKSHNAVHGLYSVHGAKFTTARLVSEVLVDQLVRNLPRASSGISSVSTHVNQLPQFALQPKSTNEFLTYVDKVIQDEQAMTLEDVLLRRTNWMERGKISVDLAHCTLNRISAYHDWSSRESARQWDSFCMHAAAHLATQFQNARA